MDAVVDFGDQVCRDAAVDSGFGVVRAMRAAEARSVSALLTSLAAAQVVSADAIILVWDRAGSGFGGFVAFKRSPEAASCAQSATRCCIEALWVASYLRGSGVEHALIMAAEHWHDRADCPESVFALSVRA